jgi:pimeloyl-ACP methyl ester carboxylesterase
MNGSRSQFLRVRGLRYHLRSWGAEDAPALFILHGFMDVSATFDPVAQRLSDRYQVMAPDWRGFGYTEWASSGYWFPDYLADLDAIVEHCSPDAPILLAGHSMGGQIASMYAGLRPARIRKLALLDSLFLPGEPVSRTPERYRSWLADVARPPRAPTYASFEQLAGRIKAKHPQLSDDQAAFVARCWGRMTATGRVELLSDPRHLWRGPRPYRQDEPETLWAEITAETLFIDGGRSPFAKTLPAGELARRRALFKGHRQTSIEDAGHMLHFDAPDTLARLLGAFFDG